MRSAGVCTAGVAVGVSNPGPGEGSITDGEGAPGSGTIGVMPGTTGAGSPGLRARNAGDAENCQ